jgi:hypothetical protein
VCIVAGCAAKPNAADPAKAPRWPSLQPSDRAWLAVTCRSDPEPAGMYPQVGHYVCIEERSGNRVRWTAWLASPQTSTFTDGRLPGPHLADAYADFAAAAAKAVPEPDSTAESLSIVVEYQPLGGDVQRTEVRGGVQAMRLLHARAARWSVLHDSVLADAPTAWWFNLTSLGRTPATAPRSE